MELPQTDTPGVSWRSPDTRRTRALAVVVAGAVCLGIAVPVLAANRTWLIAGIVLVVAYLAFMAGLLVGFGSPMIFEFSKRGVSTGFRLIPWNQVAGYTFCPPDMLSLEVHNNVEVWGMDATMVEFHFPPDLREDLERVLSAHVHGR